MDKHFCPESVVVVEPILEALSAVVPCTGTGTPGATHFLFLPITFKFYIKIKNLVPKSDSIVCIGCDSHYGPNRNLLETSFERPYKLFLEYPSEYVHNAAFKKMMGYGELHFFQICQFFTSYFIFARVSIDSTYSPNFICCIVLYLLGNGESMTFIKKFQPQTNETQYTKRVMKIIEYVPV